MMRIIMLLTLLKAKLHRAVITSSDLTYEGSISIDADLLRASGILPHEQVDVLNINNGARFTTYAIAAEAGSHEIVVNGAAARLVQKGDVVIICAFASMTAQEAAEHHPTVILLDEHNHIKS
jgi:aspartate 1-decarboxylase